MKKNDNKDLVEQYKSIMKDYEPKPFISADWPMENGVYKQYSAFENQTVSVGGTSYSL